mmetsp:Transcript_73888/g.210844  ORF Transcript_73888/g.210844 Transcript_73888/m.210844 type:complete len:107 (-) Transcript_73888:664-984(-)
MKTDCAARTTGMVISEVFDISTTDVGSSYDKAFAYTGVDTERKWVVAAFKGSNETDDFIYDMQVIYFGSVGGVTSGDVLTLSDEGWDRSGWSGLAGCARTFDIVLA